jgi:hypothetical protein
MVFGAPDVMRLALTPQAPHATDPAWLRMTNVGFKGLAVVIFAITVWLLLTDGAVFIEFLRRHH